MIISAIYIKFLFIERPKFLLNWENIICTFRNSFIYQITFVFLNSKILYGREVFFNMLAKIFCLQDLQWCFGNVKIFHIQDRYTTVLQAFSNLKRKPNFTLWPTSIFHTFVCFCQQFSFSGTRYYGRFIFRLSKLLYFQLLSNTYPK